MSLVDGQLPEGLAIPTLGASPTLSEVRRVSEIAAGVLEREGRKALSAAVFGAGGAMRSAAAALREVREGIEDGSPAALSARLGDAAASLRNLAGFTKWVAEPLELLALSLEAFAKGRLAMLRADMRDQELADTSGNCGFDQITQISDLNVLRPDWSRPFQVGEASYVSQDCEIPKQITVPLLRPRSARHIASVSWSLGPASSRSDDLFLSFDRSRGFYLLWFEWTADGASESRVTAFIPRSGLQSSAAACALVRAQYGGEQHEYESSNGPWTWASAGLLSETQLSHLASTLWPDSRSMH